MKMKKQIKDFTYEEKEKICAWHKRHEPCTFCPLQPLCMFNVFGAMGVDMLRGGNPNLIVIEVDDEILK